MNYQIWAMNTFTILVVAIASVLLYADKKEKTTCKIKCYVLTYWKYCYIYMLKNIFESMLHLMYKTVSSIKNCQTFFAKEMHIFVHARLFLHESKEIVTNPSGPGRENSQRIL